jgi:hypothetical protein
MTYYRLEWHDAHDMSPKSGYRYLYAGDYPEPVATIYKSSSGLRWKLYEALPGISAPGWMKQNDLEEGIAAATRAMLEMATAPAPAEEPFVRVGSRRLSRGTEDLK